MCVGYKGEKVIERLFLVSCHVIKLKVESGKIGDSRSGEPGPL